jgi:hypothetical protein
LNALWKFNKGIKKNGCKGFSLWPFFFVETVISNIRKKLIGDPKTLKLSKKISTFQRLRFKGSGHYHMLQKGLVA